MEHEITLTDSTFDQQIQGSTEPILVDFWAEWCMPCRMIAPVISSIAKDYNGKLRVGKLNVDDNPMTAGRFGISGIPTLLLFKDGKLVDQWVGALPKTALEAALKPHLSDKV